MFRLTFPRVSRRYNMREQKGKFKNKLPVHIGHQLNETNEDMRVKRTRILHCSYL